MNASPNVLGFLVFLSAFSSFTLATPGLSKILSGLLIDVNPPALLIFDLGNPNSTLACFFFKAASYFGNNPPVPLGNRGPEKSFLNYSVLSA